VLPGLVSLLVSSVFQWLFGVALEVVGGLLHGTCKTDGPHVARLPISDVGGIHALETWDQFISREDTCCNETWRIRSTLVAQRGVDV
jgi:hypothetical protein